MWKGAGGEEEESLGQELRVCRKGTSTVVLGQGRERKGKERVSDSACEPGIDRGLPMEFWLR